MLNDNAKKWVAALRSGEFKQGKGALAKYNKFCCLGVACEVADRNGVELRRGTCTRGVTTSKTDAVTYNGGTSSLPLGVKLWLGVRTPTGSYFNEHASTSLITDNDILDKTFAEIADIIESEPEGLFEGKN